MILFLLCLGTWPVVLAAPGYAEERCAAGIALTGPVPPASMPGSEHASGAGVTVAVIDTGVASHPQLRNLDAGSDLVSPESPDPFHDCDAHGTIVAGIIASADRGIAPGARILSIRQTSSTTSHPDETSRARGTLSSLAQAIREAVDRGARVINVSVVACVPPERAQRLDTRVLDEALDHAEQQGSVVVAAAGNRSTQCQDSSVVYPAHAPTVVAVGALDDPHDLADYSLSSGRHLLAAPGRLAAGLDPQGPGWIGAVGSPDSSGFISAPQELIGTSFAAPVVSGIAALLLEQQPDYSPAQVRAHLFAAAQPPHGAITTHDAIATILPRSAPPREIPAVSRPVPPDTRAQSQSLHLASALGCAVLGGMVIRGFLLRYRSQRPSAHTWG
nr:MULTISPECIES: S8 family serine peptidase [unclassified Corynebacterium]